MLTQQIYMHIIDQNMEYVSFVTDYTIVYNMTLHKFGENTGVFRTRVYFKMFKIVQLVKIRLTPKL